MITEHQNSPVDYCVYFCISLYFSNCLNWGGGEPWSQSQCPDSMVRAYCCYVESCFFVFFKFGISIICIYLFICLLLMVKSAFPCLLAFILPGSCLLFIQEFVTVTWQKQQKHIVEKETRRQNLLSILRLHYQLNSEWDKLKENEITKLWTQRLKRQSTLPSTEEE